MANGLSAKPSLYTLKACVYLSVLSLSLGPTYTRELPPLGYTWPFQSSSQEAFLAQMEVSKKQPLMTSVVQQPLTTYTLVCSSPQVLLEARRGLTRYGSLAYAIQTSCMPVFSRSTLLASNLKIQTLQKRLIRFLSISSGTRKSTRQMAFFMRFIHSLP